MLSCQHSGARTPPDVFDTVSVERARNKQEDFEESMATGNSNMTVDGEPAPTGQATDAPVAPAPTVPPVVVVDSVNSSNYQNQRLVAVLVAVSVVVVVVMIPSES